MSYTTTGGSVMSIEFIKQKNSKNSVHYLKWIFTRKDSLNQVTFIFKSKINANNARMLPLFEKSNNIKIVYFNGISLKYSDKFLIYLFKLLIKTSNRKISNYSVLHVSSPEYRFKNIKSIYLHIDDPVYNFETDQALLGWQHYYKSNGTFTYIICTNDYTQLYFSRYLLETKVFVVEQGYEPILISKTKKASKDIICAYSSPYLHYWGDKHELHTAWNVTCLIDEIIPKVNSLDNSIKFLIIGDAAKQAKKALQSFENVEIINRVNHIDNIRILTACDVGLYPRTHDHKRSVLKVYSYIGANLPVITFDLIDTSIVKKLNLGFSVKSTSEFAEKIIFLKQHPDKLEKFKKQVEKIKVNFSWTHLAQKLDKIVENELHTSKNVARKIQ
jgi:hypothetical protein